MSFVFFKTKFDPRSHHSPMCGFSFYSASQPHSSSHHLLITYHTSRITYREHLKPYITSHHIAHHTSHITPHLNPISCSFCTCITHASHMHTCTHAHMHTCTHAHIIPQANAHMHTPHITHHTPHHITSHHQNTSYPIA